MKKFFIGFFLGVFLCFTGLAAAAQDPIKLIVNGREIQCDVPPQLINGRVLVPARFVAEPLGARVEWDEQGQAVRVISVSTPEEKQMKKSASINNYYTARQILVSIKKKYPNMKYVSRDNAEVKQGEFRFDNRTGELWFNEQKFLLPKKSPDSLLYFSISPLIEAKILISSDIQPLQ